MVTLAERATLGLAAETADSEAFSGPLPTHSAHDHAAHEPHVAPRPPATTRMSLLRMGLPLRLAFAAGATVLLWSAIALGLS